jgi:hypothetical protein
MGRSIKILIVIFFVATSVILILGDYTNPRRDIFFRYNSKLSFYYLLGYLPQQYHIDYTEKIVEESEAYKLTNLIYNKFSSENHNYLLFDEKEKKITTKILFDSDSLFWYFTNTLKLLSSQINIPVFKKYIELKGLKHKSEVINQLCVFFADFDSSKFEVVKSFSRISELRQVNVFNRDNTGECYKVLRKNFNADFNLYEYLWFDGIGFFEVSFEFESEKLLRIHDEFIFGPIYLSIAGSDKCQS